METYILILTLLASGVNNGQGGIAMSEFANKSSCESAGEQWMKSLPDGTFTIGDRGSFYICVPKESKE